MFSNEPAIRDDGAHVVVTLRGELDIANAADLGAVLSEAVARNPHVIADLSDLTFIDCASLGVLVRARTRAREAGGDLVLAGARGGCSGSSPCRAWLACSLSVPAWTRRRGKDLTCTFLVVVAIWCLCRLLGSAYCSDFTRAFRLFGPTSPQRARSCWHATNSSTTLPDNASRPRRPQNSTTASQHLP